MTLGGSDSHHEIPQKIAGDQFVAAVSTFVWLLN